MFSSLDRVDLVTQDKATGKKRFIQTDHRSAREIRQEEELSILFALARVMNARWMGEPEGATVEYVCTEPPPDFLRRTVVSAGGRIQIHEQQTSPYEGVLGTPEELADTAFRRLAHRVVRERSWVLEERSLVELQREHADAPDPEEDELGYWTRVVELAAVTGELLRAKFGGRWVEAPRMATIPFAFRLGPEGESRPLISPVGKAEKFLVNGERDSLVQLLRMAEDHGGQATGPRPVLLTLKIATWAGRDKTVCQPLIDWRDPTMPIPWMAYGEDLPNSFAIFIRDGARERDIGLLHAEALDNLKAVEVQIEEVDAGELKLLAVSGHYFAAEKVVDVGFMKRMHERLGSKLLVAGVPRRGLLLITNAIVQPRIMSAFLAICEAEYEKKSSEPICSTPLLIQEGKVSGLVREGGEEDTPPVSHPAPAPPRAPAAEPRPGFFSRLFGWKKG
jgi:hypothetical protein